MLIGLGIRCVRGFAIFFHNSKTQGFTGHRDNGVSSSFVHSLKDFGQQRLEHSGAEGPDWREVGVITFQTTLSVQAKASGCAAPSHTSA
jgi:hypothetical protein